MESAPLLSLFRPRNKPSSDHGALRNNSNAKRKTNRRRRRAQRQPSSSNNSCDSSSWMAQVGRLQRILQRSPFLQETPCHSTIPRLKKNQLRVGSLVGEGSFSQVFQVRGFDKYVVQNTQNMSSANPQDDATETTVAESYSPSGSTGFGTKILRTSKSGGGHKSFFHSHFSSISSKRKTSSSAANGQRRYVVKHVHAKLTQQRYRSSSSSNSNSANSKQINILEEAAVDLFVEALFLCRLQHPHIIPIRGMSSLVQGEDQDTSGFFFVTDYLPWTLDRRIQVWTNPQRQHHHVLMKTQSAFHNPEYQNHQSLDAAPSLRRRVEYALQLASALEYLHEQRIIYRDVKPQNIGFSDDDQIQLFDLGLCRQLPPPSEAAMGGPAQDQLRFCMTNAGTFRYKAGELLLGQAYNEKVDVYSWALTVYEMWTFKPAFPNCDSFTEAGRADHIEKVCVLARRPGVRLYNLPAPLERVLRKSWVRNVNKRYTMSQVCRDLEQYLLQ